MSVSLDSIPAVLQSKILDLFGTVDLNLDDMLNYVDACACFRRLNKTCQDRFDKNEKFQIHRDNINEIRAVYKEINKNYHGELLVRVVQSEVFNSKVVKRIRIILLFNSMYYIGKAVFSEASKNLQVPLQVIESFVIYNVNKYKELQKQRNQNRLPMITSFNSLTKDISIKAQIGMNLSNKKLDIKENAIVLYNIFRLLRIFDYKSENEERNIEIIKIFKKYKCVFTKSLL